MVRHRGVERVRASVGESRASAAKAALARGDNVALAARRTDALDEVARAYPDSALPVTLDATDGQARNLAVTETIHRFGGIDVLANIAGRGSLGAAEEFSPDQLRDQLEINFFAAAELTRLVLPGMRARGSGRVVNLTSIGGLVAVGGFSAYCAAKFALEGWSEALRDEVKPLGIHVTIVEPGAFRTEFAGDKNMRPDKRIDAYRPVIEPIERYLYGSDGKQPGDPDRAAAAMIAAIDNTTPPLRLLLGADAIGLWEKKRSELEGDLAAWRKVGEDTAFPGATVAPVGG